MCVPKKGFCQFESLNPNQVPVSKKVGKGRKKKETTEPEPEPEPIWGGGRKKKATTEPEPEPEPEPDELLIPNQAPLPSRPGIKYVAQGTLAAIST